MIVRTIAAKEFVQALLTYRFAVGLILCVVAVSAGTLAVIEDYAARREAYHKAQRDYEADVLEQEGPYAKLVFDLQAFRAPRQLAVFSVGSDRWQGNQVEVTHHLVPVQSEWLGTANPYMVVFRTVDVTLIVQIILGLLALLFAHDAVCGEREEGTLQLMLANPVARDQVLAGKTIGHLAVLFVLLAVTFVVALLFVQVSPQLHLGFDEIVRVLAIFVLSALYVTAMYVVGLLLSTWAARSATALVLAVFGWLLGVAVYPNVTSFAVDAWSPVLEDVANAQSQHDQLRSSFSEWIRPRTKASTGNEWEPRLGGYSSSSNWRNPRGFWVGGFMSEAQAEKSRQRAVDLGEPVPDIEADSEAEIERRAAELAPFFEEVEQQRIAFADRIWREAWEPVETTMKRVHDVAVGLSVLSPAGAYRRAAAVLAQTERDDYWRFLDSARQYRRELITFYEQGGWFRSRTWFNDQAGEGHLDDLPVYQERPEGIWESLGRAATPLVVLGLFCLVPFLAAYWRFRRYDLTG